VQAFAETELRGLLEHRARHGGNSVDVLRSFLELSGNKTELAKKLPVPPHALRETGHDSATTGNPHECADRGVVLSGQRRELLRGVRFQFEREHDRRDRPPGSALASTPSFLDLLVPLVRMVVPRHGG